MAISTGLLTVAEFARLPQPEGGVRQELHHGELVEMPPVNILHTLLQMRLAELIRAQCDSSVYGVTPEFPFQATPEFDVRIADVAVFQLIDAMKSLKGVYFRGVPDMVIEVLSPSNTVSEMLDREAMCLQNGGKEFWLVDPSRRTVKVVQADGSWAAYGLGSFIESCVLTGPLPVRDIFDSLVLL